MSAQSIGWHGEQDLSERRRVRRAMSISIGVHVALFVALVISPPASFEPIPQTIAVELIAGPQIAAPVAPRAPVRRKASPPPPAPKPPVEQAAPEPPAPAPPKPKAPVQVLPENERKPEKKVKQAPEKEKTQEVAKARTEPAPEKKQPEKPPAKTPAKEADESLSYEDAMNSLDEELGEDTTDDLLAPPPPRPGTRTTPTSGNAPESRAGVSLNAEDAAWGLAVRRKVGGTFVMPSNFRGRGLVTAIRLEITTAGTLVGKPEVQRSSGDPYFDDFALLAVIKAEPLPEPPRPGQLSLLFSAEDY